jgi:hypothetical protein
LAKKLNTVHLSNDGLRDAIIKRRVAKNTSNINIGRYEISQELTTQGRPLLTGGKSLLVDMCFNSPNSRLRRPIYLA